MGTKAKDKTSKPLHKVEGRSTDTNSRYTWILDAGHGGVKDGEYQTSGKRSPIWDDGSIYYEGAGNREIARKVAHALFKLGIHYEFTVAPEDPQDVPLQKRVEIANSLPYKNKIGVSIHSNGATDANGNPIGRGWEVYTTPGYTVSDEVATIFYNTFEELFPGEKFRSDKDDGDPDKEANFYIIRNTKCPFILLENFFHTNERECKKFLMSEDGQNRIVDAIVASILYIEQNGL